MNAVLLALAAVGLAWSLWPLWGLQAAKEE
jgi:hypothetical protein